MGLPTTDCTSPGDACCTGVYDIADHILLQVFEAVTDCQTCDCEKVKAYVTVGSGDDAVVDALTIAAVSITPMPSARQGTIVVNRVTYDVRLRESGWPIVEAVGSEIVMPDPVRQNRAALHVYAHCEAMYRRLTHLAAKRELTPHGVNGQGSVSGLFLLPPRGGVVGGYATVTVDIG